MGVVCATLSSCNCNVKTLRKTQTNSAGSKQTSQAQEKSEATVDKPKITLNETHSQNTLPTMCTPNPDSSVLSMNVIPQEEEYWCWAACGQMAMEKLPTDPVTQCDQANKSFNLDTCCQSPRPTCNRPGLPRFDQYGFDPDTTFDQALPWDQIKKQIDCERRPFCGSWRYTDDDVRCSGTNRGPDTSGHMVVISGYKVVNTKHWVKILDPYPKNKGATYWLRYSDYVCGSGYAHWNDYYNIKK